MTETPFLTIGMWRHCKDVFTKHEQVNQSVSHEAVYRTALATPGVLIIVSIDNMVTINSIFIMNCLKYGRY